MYINRTFKNYIVMGFRPLMYNDVRNTQFYLCLRQKDHYKMDFSIGK